MQVTNIPKTRWRPPFYYGWVIVGVFAVCHFTQSAEIYPVLSVLLKPMTAEFGWSRTTFAVATSIGTLVGGLAGPIVGPSVDRWGAKWILLVSFTVLGTLMILQGGIQEIWQFYAIQILSRMISQGIISLALQIMIPNWFVKRRARAIAVGSLGGRLGNSITPIYVQALISGYTWRVATVTTGMVMLSITLLPIALFVKRRPEDIGLLPDGDKPTEEASPEGASPDGEGTSTDPLDTEHVQAPASTVEGDVSYPLREVLKMSSFYMLLGATVTSTLVGPAMNLHMIPFFTDRGISPETAVLVTTTLFLTSAVGSLIGAFFAERFGIKNVMVADGILLGLWLVFLIPVNSPVMAFTWAATQGILQGASMVVRQVLFADYYGRNSLGTIRGVINPLQLASNAAGPTAAAMVFDATGSYTTIFLFFGLMRIISGLMVLWAKPPLGSAAARGRTHFVRSASGS